jgi:hypothetical protein
VQLHAVTRIGHLSAGNDKSLAFIEYEHSSSCEFAYGL